jgi:hypothetical protein
MCSCSGSCVPEFGRAEPFVSHHYASSALSSTCASVLGSIMTTTSTSIIINNKMLCLFGLLVAMCASHGVKASDAANDAVC